MVPLLERLSLVRIGHEALDRVVRLVEFSQVIREVDTKGADGELRIEPMMTPSERDSLRLRDDVALPTDRKETLANAAKLVEDYFVTPGEHKHYSKL